MLYNVTGETKLSDHFKKIIIPLHILSLLCIPYFSTNYIIPFLVGWVLISGFGIAIGQHRYFCHNSFKTYKVFHILLGWLACLGSQGSTIFWNAAHANHHGEADTKNDVHSPLHGTWNAYWGWILNLDPKNVPMKYSKRLIKDSYQKWLHQNYYKVVWGSVAIFAVLNFLAVGDMYLTLYGMILPMSWSTHQEPIINILGHINNFGYRNYNTRDNSTNSRLLAMLTFGQCYHNNHHANPHRYNFGSKWTEFDPAAPLVMLIKKYS